MRLVVVPEVNSNMRLAEAKFKTLTGEREQRARSMHRDLLTFPTRSTLFMMSNKHSQIRTGGLCMAAFRNYPLRASSACRRS